MESRKKILKCESVRLVNKLLFISLLVMGALLVTLHLQTELQTEGKFIRSASSTPHFPSPGIYAASCRLSVSCPID